MSWHSYRREDYSYRTCDICGVRDRERSQDGEEISAHVIGWIYRGPVPARLHACAGCRQRGCKRLRDMELWRRDDDEA